ncbi:MAG: arylamine N-acetyltransferase family protein [Acidimicrobiales bacterium]
MPDRLDLDAYLARIGVDDPPGPDLDSLRSIVAHHATAIAFENLDPFCRVPVGLDVASLEAKLVHGGRGGWCFEQNLLLRHALDAIGFRITGLAARVMWLRPPDSEQPLPARGHMLLRVDLDEGPHLVDVGFGGLTLTGVLRLEADREQDTPHEPFRIVCVGADDLAMQARLRGDWATLYQFSLQAQLQADYEVTNWYLSTHPESHFLHGIMVARPAESVRYALRNDTLTTHHLGGESERRAITTIDELRDVLGDIFLLRVPETGQFDDAVGRLLTPISSPR